MSAPSPVLASTARCPVPQSGRTFLVAVVISLAVHAVAIAAAGAYLVFKNPSQEAEPVCPVTNFMKVHLIKAPAAAPVQMASLAPAAKPKPARQTKIAQPTHTPQPALQTLAPALVATAPIAETHTDFIATQSSNTPGSSPATAISARVAPGTNTAIRYPESARRLGWEGVVTLNFWLNESGKPSQFRIASTSGYPELDARALQTVRTWRFESQGQPAWASLPITFKLTD